MKRGKLSRHSLRKAAQRAAHAAREDNRRPIDSQPLDLVRDGLRDQRRAARRAAREDK